MTHSGSVLPWVASFSLALLFLVETLSWYLRAMALDAGRAYVISKSNLILYTSRLFAFLFQVSISYYLETRGTKFGILASCVAGFSLAALSHLLIFFVVPVRRKVWGGIRWLLALMNRWDDNIISPIAPMPRLVRLQGLFRITGGSTFIFCVATVVPYFFAVRYPDLRLTFASMSQLLNFLGTILLLYSVDPKLYSMMDQGTLHQHIYDYIGGRVLGFLAAFLCSALAYEIL